MKTLNETSISELHKEQEAPIQDRICEPFNVKIYMQKLHQSSGKK